MQALATSSASLELLAEYRRARYSSAEEDGTKQPPSREEVREIAQHLKFDLAAHPSLEWLAREAIDAPLPAEWSEQMDGYGRAFYFHKVSGRSQFSHPHDALFSRTYASLSAVLQPADD